MTNRSMSSDVRNTGLLVTTSKVKTSTEKHNSLFLSQETINPLLSRSLANITGSRDELKSPMQYHGHEGYQSMTPSSARRRLRHGATIMSNGTLNYDDTMSVFSEPEPMHSGRISSWNGEGRLSKMKPSYLQHPPSIIKPQVSYRQYHNQVSRPITPNVLFNPDGTHLTSEVKAVDPELKDAQKAGNQYHISMSLNAALSQSSISNMSIHSREQIDVDTAKDYSLLYEPSRSENIQFNQHPVANNISLLHIIPNNMNNMNVQKNIFVVDDGLSIKSIKSMPSRTTTPIAVMERKSEEKVGFDLELERLADSVQIVHHSHLNNHHSNTEHSASELSEPRLMMSLNQTMMLDCQPPAENTTRKLNTNQRKHKEKPLHSETDYQPNEQLNKRGNIRAQKLPLDEDDQPDEPKTKRSNDRAPKKSSDKLHHRNEEPRKRGNNRAPPKLPSDEDDEPDEQTMRRGNNRAPKAPSDKVHLPKAEINQRRPKLISDIDYPSKKKKVPTATLR